MAGGVRLSWSEPERGQGGDNKAVDAKEIRTPRGRTTPPRKQGRLRGHYLYPQAAEEGSDCGRVNLSPLPRVRQHHGPYEGKAEEDWGRVIHEQKNSRQI